MDSGELFGISITGRVKNIFGNKGVMEIFSGQNVNTGPSGGLTCLSSAYWYEQTWLSYLAFGTFIEISIEYR